jgi:hypothetical protein
MQPAIFLKKLLNIYEEVTHGVRKITGMIQKKAQGSSVIVAEVQTITAASRYGGRTNGNRIRRKRRAICNYGRNCIGY